MNRSWSSCPEASPPGSGARVDPTSSAATALTIHGVAGDPTGGRGMTGRERGAVNAAVAAEPSGIGSARARDPLAREVRLLGALLGQVLVEQGGPELLATVERIRRRTIAIRRGADPDVHRQLTVELDRELDALSLEDAEAVVRAFTLYFRLLNVATEREEVRGLRKRERAARDGIVEDSVADVVRRLRSAGHPAEAIEALVGRLEVTPVLTANPTEARRRTLLVALRRIGDLVGRLDDPRL